MEATASAATAATTAKSAWKAFAVSSFPALSAHELGGIILVLVLVFPVDMPSVIFTMLDLESARVMAFSGSACADDALLEEAAPYLVKVRHALVIVANRVAVDDLLKSARSGGSIDFGHGFES